MHRDKDDCLVEEDLVERVSVVHEHDIVLVVAFDEFRLVDTCPLSQVAIKLLKAYLQSVLTRQAQVICEVGSSIIENHSEPVNFLL